MYSMLYFVRVYVGVLVTIGTHHIVIFLNNSRN
jgi:hypothetical protein